LGAPKIRPGDGIVGHGFHGIGEIFLGRFEMSLAEMADAPNFVEEINPALRVL
jgi:hypothetical protein